MLGTVGEKQEKRQSTTVERKSVLEDNGKRIKQTAVVATPHKTAASFRKRRVHPSALITCNPM